MPKRTKISAQQAAAFNVLYYADQILPYQAQRFVNMRYGQAFISMFHCEGDDPNPELYNAIDVTTVMKIIGCEYIDWTL